MKLLSKYNRINIIVSISVLLISSISFYIMIRKVLINQLDESLKVEEQEIIAFVKANNKLPESSNYKDQLINFKESKQQFPIRSFKSILFYNDKEQEEILYRQLQFSISVANKNYIAIVSNSQKETEDLIKIIAIITLAIIILLLAILLVINRFLLSQLWKPFNQTLNELKKFNLSSTNNLLLQTTDIIEFTELNKSVSLMTERVKKDYESLKNFTDNASHEMQTPLAIINSKLDVLIQDEKLTEFQMQQLQGVYNALQRLSSLNKSLLTLTKIEHQQFSELENIFLDELVKRNLNELEEFITTKNISITKVLKNINLIANKQLVEIIIINLLSNAVKYNFEKGVINIILQNNTLTISNTSLINELDNTNLFQRFYRHSNSNTDGNGLGLSIVKEICEISSYKISYHYLNNLHSFSIIF